VYKPVGECLYWCGAWRWEKLRQAVSHAAERIVRTDAWRSGACSPSGS